MTRLDHDFVCQVNYIFAYSLITHSLRKKIAKLNRLKTKVKTEIT